MKGILVLEDGTVYTGKALGTYGQTEGEVVFNTGMVGYQEVITDPSYAGQIVVMTYPIIGNYGVNYAHVESARPRVKGVIIKEHCHYPSNWLSEDTFHNYLAKHKVVGLCGIDTRSLTKKIRSKGTMGGIIASGIQLDIETLKEKANGVVYNRPDLVKSVTTSTPYQIPGVGPKVVVMDFGIKHSILKNLKNVGCDLTVVPSHTSVEDILKLDPDGIFLSNGPGDPKDVPEVVETVKEILGKKPMFGICLGHQIMGLAMGADTFKLKFGHRGANHPVQDLSTGKVYITSQNHGYAINWESIADEIIVTHKNLNDDTVEGIKHPLKKAFSVQYHPEAVPGPEDSMYLFEQFIELMTEAK